MARRQINLAARIDGNGSGGRGSASDFPVRLRPLFYDADLTYEPVPNRLAVVREDTGEALAVVSDRYTLVPHQEILGAVEQAVGQLDVGTVQRGVYLDRRGARLRALFKFPGLEQPVRRRDTICPCLKVQNTYDGTSRVTVHIGAFRFVCTNLSVGGGGAFAGGFMAVHQGDIRIDEVAGGLRQYLEGFDQIVSLYGAWSQRPMEPDAWGAILGDFPKRPAKEIRSTIGERWNPTVFDAYNACTYHATHRMRSVHGAFDLLERTNRAFQEHVPSLPG